MGENTNIAWTSTRRVDGTLVPGHTFNPWIGCMKVSPGCTNCYAEGQAERYGWHVWGPAVHPRTGEVLTQRRRTSTSYWKQPFAWNKKAEAAGEHRRVFCASMADMFEEHPDLVSWRRDIWPIIEQTPWLDWLLLTKRPENIHKMMPIAWLDRFHLPKNIWVGTSVETEEYAHKRIPWLLDIPASVRFLSCEPLLGAIDLSPWLSLLQWIIVGGESGPKHRPMNLDHARSIRDQCFTWNVPFFFKQVGGLTHASGGHLLDGVEYYQFPEIKEQSHQ